MLRHCGFILLFLGLTEILHAQVQVLFQLQTQKQDAFYLAGNINNWKPNDPQYRFSTAGKLVLQLQQGDVLTYKITRGQWEKVEVDSAGHDIENRVLRVMHDTTVFLHIDSWRDDFGPAPEKKHTATSQVAVLDSAFYMPQLKRSRTIRIYLPPDYYSSSKKYPVLYMQDGQNCFDDYTSGFGEWEADETLNHFYDSCKKSMIVIAIDHGGQYRFQEYSPYDHAQYGKGEGKAYVDFLVQTLKPFIDRTYRTLPGRKNTAIAGSSMGGLISLYAILNYPATFGKAGVFSPAFWVVPALYNAASKQVKNMDTAMIYFYAGGQESKTMVPDMQKMEAILKKNNKLQIKENVDEAALHNEAAWRKWFPVFLRWINE